MIIQEVRKANGVSTEKAVEYIKEQEQKLITLSKSRKLGYFEYEDACTSLHIPVAFINYFRFKMGE
ncbi:MAG: hypothetical protein IJ759_05925 [Bacteroidales bacterium]|nr:hypothetical protein [Bacteroidales bacterium]